MEIRVNPTPDNYKKLSEYWYTNIRIKGYDSVNIPFCDPPQADNERFIFPVSF